MKKIIVIGGGAAGMAAAIAAAENGCAADLTLNKFHTVIDINGKKCQVT